MFRKNHPNKGSFCSQRSHCWNWTLAESKTQTKLNAENRKYCRGAGKSQRRPQHPATEGSPAARGESQRRPQNPVTEGSPTARAGVGTEACSCAPKINEVHPCSKNSAKHRGTIESQLLKGQLTERIHSHLGPTGNNGCWEGHSQ